MHDLLPWDEDMDIMVHNNSKHKLIELFKDDRNNGIQGYYMQKTYRKTLKFYFNYSKSAGKRP